MSDLQVTNVSVNPALHANAGAASWMGIWGGAATRLADLTAQAIRTSLDEQRAIALAAAEERSPLGVWRLQTSYSLAGTAKTVAYFRHATEIVLDTLTDAVADAEGRMNQNFMAVTGALEQSAARGEATILTAEVPSPAQAAEGAAQIVDAAGKAVSSTAAAASKAAGASE
ncbi:TIGR01841 family phasin [Paraburkholderia acidisoli]|uniref:TIGR01841 family phasin n=1 Tax=Paraburkholderia acidisoli TaxID=2571748 RepID=A0A7Z2GS16_9BURK|nr:TIGR01841 family phasin [Paraburkholderia acidisoli]QGZ66700.1 TIGR01841 family phasin [Paraburkholderia acidisoli]